MILRFRDERIHRLEACLAGRMPMDHYLMDENKRLVEEIELVRRQNDHNPELTRFAMDNIRLMEQVRGYVVSILKSMSLSSRRLLYRNSENMILEPAYTGAVLGSEQIGSLFIWQVKTVF
jgi:hypothetical protein